MCVHMTKQHCCSVLDKVSRSKMQHEDSQVGVLQDRPAKWHFLQVIDRINDLAEVCFWQAHLAKMAPPVDGLL